MSCARLLDLQFRQARLPPGFASAMTACVICGDDLKALLAACGPVRPPTSAGGGGGGAGRAPAAGRGGGGGGAAAALGGARAGSRAAAGPVSIRSRWGRSFRQCRLLSFLTIPLLIAAIWTCTQTTTHRVPLLVMKQQLHLWPPSRAAFWVSMCTCLWQRGGARGARGAAGSAVAGRRRPRQDQNDDAFDSDADDAPSPQRGGRAQRARGAGRQTAGR